jgi:cell division protein FtsB
LIEPKAPSPDQQLLQEQEQEKSIRQLSQESSALRKRLTDLERRHQAIQDIFVGSGW